MEHLDPRSYPPDWHMYQMGQRYLELILGVCDPIEGPSQLGDIVLYHFGKCISHGAVVIEWPQVIHSYIHHPRWYQRKFSPPYSGLFSYEEA